MYRALTSTGQREAHQVLDWAHDCGGVHPDDGSLKLEHVRGELSCSCRLGWVVAKEVVKEGDNLLDI